MTGTGIPYRCASGKPTPARQIRVYGREKCCRTGTGERALVYDAEPRRASAARKPANELPGSSKTRVANM